jgi:hypothetical protein
MLRDFADRSVTAGDQHGFSRVLQHRGKVIRFGDLIYWLVTLVADTIEKFVFRNVIETGRRIMDYSNAHRFSLRIR